MNSATAALLALLLVCSLPAMSVAAGPAGGGAAETERPAAVSQDALQPVAPTDVENTSNRLELTGEVRTDHVEQGPDLGTALAAADDELRVDHDRYVLLDSEFEDATREERIELLDATENRLSERADALETREEEAVHDHASGESTSIELARVLVRNYHEAAAISDALDELSARAGEVPGYSVSVGDDQNKLELQRTDIRTKLDAAVHGESSDSEVVTLQTSADGYAITSIGDDYVRETVQFTNRNAEAPDQFGDIADAYHAAGEKYPWVFETGERDLVSHYAVQLYQIRVPSHAHGELEAYLDGGTGEVYREIQVLNYDALPTAEDDKWRSDGLSLTIEDTPANGPSKVTVNDTNTGAPATATITIDGVVVGETDDDGIIWIQPPIGDEYELEADTETSHINATITD